MRVEHRRKYISEDWTQENTKIEEWESENTNVKDQTLKSSKIEDW